MAQPSVQEIYDKVLATKRATTCISELVETMLADDITDDDDDDDVLCKQHTIMTSLLKCADAFQPMGLQAPDARGAIAEMMCCYLLNRWLEDRSIYGSCTNGVMLKVYPNTPSREDTTEIDVALVTDRMICIVECKSFRGNKVTDGSVISTKNIAKQPWNQNLGHVIAFTNNAKKYLPTVQLPPIYNVVYMFAEGKFTDWKQPDEADRFLLLNLGAFSMLDRIYEESTGKLSNVAVDQVTKFFKDNEPTVEQQTEHVLRIKSFI